MERVAVLLRGVNVGGHNRIAMAAFREVLEGLGCADVQTYLQSGNAVVTSPGGGLAATVRRALREQLELDVEVLVRTADELDAVVAGNPLEVDLKMLHAVLLDGPLPDGALDPPTLLPDQVAVGDRVVYVRYADGSRDSKAARLLSSKRFPVVSTARNWRTVLALQELARG